MKFERALQAKDALVVQLQRDVAGARAQCERYQQRVRDLEGHLSRAVHASLVLEREGSRSSAGGGGGGESLAGSRSSGGGGGSQVVEGSGTQGRHSQQQQQQPGVEEQVALLAEQGAASETTNLQQAPPQLSAPSSSPSHRPLHSPSSEGSQHPHHPADPAVPVGEVAGSGTSGVRSGQSIGAMSASGIAPHGSAAFPDTSRVVDDALTDMGAPGSASKEALDAPSKDPQSPCAASPDVTGASPTASQHDPQEHTSKSPASSEHYSQEHAPGPEHPAPAIPGTETGAGGALSCTELQQQGSSPDEEEDAGDAVALLRPNEFLQQAPMLPPAAPPLMENPSPSGGEGAPAGPAAAALPLRVQEPEQAPEPGDAHVAAPGTAGDPD